MQNKVVLGTVLAAMGGVPAIAQEVMELDPIIVSGGLTPIDAQVYGRSASVVTAQDIQRQGIQTVQDALRNVPGVSVNSAGGSYTQVRIRGSEANHVLVLIDGVAAQGGDGSYTFRGLSTENIERIEVLRGPQSVYYGSNAAAGVINIITNKGGPGFSANGSVEAGNGYTASAHISQRTDRGGISLNAARIDDDGYDYSRQDGEKDGFEREEIGVAGDWFVTDDLRLGFTVNRADEHFDYDDTDWMNAATATEDDYIVDDPSLFGDQFDLTSEIYGELSMFGGTMTHRLAYQSTKTEYSYDGGDTTKLWTDVWKYRMSLGLDGRQVTDTSHLLNVLVERQEDGSKTNDDYERDANSLAVEYRGTLEMGLSYQAGLRYDDNSEFEDATTWTVGLSYLHPETGIRFHGSAGTGIVNPTYFELFADEYGYIGNPDLEPEKNRGYDFGVEVPFWAGRGLVDVTYFNETATDEIISVATATGYTYENQSGDSDREGVEVTGALRATEALDFTLAYTWLNAKDPDGETEVRRPEHELVLGASLDLFDGRGNLSGNVRHVAGNYDDQNFGTFERKELPDYTTVDIAGRYDLTKRLSLNARVTNLLDVDHTEAWGYGSQGRTGYVGVRAAW
ncbi:TonB-dependent receptor plug domain-containing protein [Qingshengfaniella alkalisoli]|uniref:TonB-dependent receptor n=1 Tax=Qingshengfaniella alkalisoli TaxID=2599296 RepID=A0A5B8IBQ1_9RHOB|nr:TonB-dependent receptor [Qingshengfaniella alkalisoli]QDY71689.1 TonB-dependent receptor [Qingshengfaniella alkalisoli]